MSKSVKEIEEQAEGLRQTISKLQAHLEELESQKKKELKVGQVWKVEDECVNTYKLILHDEISDTYGWCYCYGFSGQIPGNMSRYPSMNELREEFFKRHPNAELLAGTLKDAIEGNHHGN